MKKATQPSGPISQLAHLECGMAQGQPLFRRLVQGPNLAFLGRQPRGGEKMGGADCDRHSPQTMDPPPPSEPGRRHHSTPTKAQIQGAIKFCDIKGLDYMKKMCLRPLRYLKPLDIASYERNHHVADTTSQEYQKPGRKSVITT